MSPISISLTYFDIPGPAEAIRLAFYVGDVQFEDKRVSRDEFAKLKAGKSNHWFPIQQQYSAENAFKHIVVLESVLNYLAAPKGIRGSAAAVL